MLTSRLELRSRWNKLCDALKLRDAEPVFDALWAAYSSPQRDYHGVRHLAESFDLLDSCRSMCDDADVVELAIWFHDVVQRPMHPDNETLPAAAPANFSRLFGRARI
jgi:predicted metal-dependent HD superfamily phosphohydrolase